jgi:hypothetical protein
MTGRSLNCSAPRVCRRPGRAAMIGLVQRELLDGDIEWNLRPAPDPPPMARDAMIVEAVLDAQAYRSMLCAALDKLRDLTLALDRERESTRRLRVELLAQRTAA